MALLLVSATLTVFVLLTCFSDARKEDGKHTGTDEFKRSFS
jgi:hypothetical protein